MIRKAIAAAALVAIAVLARDAGACSCMPPEASLMSPDRTEDASTNTKIRIEVPSPAFYGSTTAQVIVRAHGGANVEAKSRKISARYLDVHELTPVAPLAPNTRYEVATVDPQRHPPTHVIGTFKTGATATADTTPPRIDRMGAVVAEKTGRYMNSCSVAGPWIVARDIVSSDPGRTDPKIVYAVWLGDNAGNVDTSKPPTRILPLDRDGNNLTIGQAGSCHFYDFPIPSTPFVWLGIAALDEAGNQSAVKKVRVDLAGAKSSP